MRSAGTVPNDRECASGSHAFMGISPAFTPNPKRARRKTTQAVGRDKVGATAATVWNRTECTARARMSRPATPARVPASLIARVTKLARATPSLAERNETSANTSRDISSQARRNVITSEASSKSGVTPMRH